MKILIVSDTHGKTEYLESVLEKEKPLDRLIHLGDIEGDEDYIPVIAECPVEIVAGNNDFFSDLPGECVIQIGRYKALLTHGHYYYVNSRKDFVRSAAVQRGAKIALFGHTHVPYIEEEAGILVACPGSLSLPRQADHCPTYLLLYISADGSCRAELQKVEK